MLGRFNKLINVIPYLPWFEVLADLWKVGSKAIRGLSMEGMYEVLEYESTLELKDRKGKQALFRKREKVRYLQDNIIAYQDQAWGDGEILLDYQCSPGKPVDFYRPGRKTYVLISLQSVMQRNDVDEFNIQWGMKDSFLRKRELWETEVSHMTRRLKVQVIFPKSRHPMKAYVVEGIRRRNFTLKSENQRRLPDGRWLISWETKNPRLDERYIIRWEW